MGKPKGVSWTGLSGEARLGHYVRPANGLASEDIQARRPGPRIVAGRC